MIFRISSKFNCSFFDLISGTTEPKQTKGLGLLLAKSPVALDLFLKLLKKGYKGLDVKALEKEDCIVHCEMPIPNAGTKGNGYADIVLFFRSKVNGSLEFAIIIEAKNLALSKNRTLAENLANQLGRYVTNHKELSGLNGRGKLLCVTLTKEKITFTNTILSITWEDVMQIFNNPVNAKGQERGLITDYFNFISKIGKTMKFYEKEILSIPAGKSIAAIEKYGVYECPKNKRYSINSVVLYLAFRKSRGGEMTKLYKVAKTYYMKLTNDDIDALAASDAAAATRLRGYVNEVPTELDKEKKVFFLDMDETIELPYTVKPEKNNTCKPYYTLKEFLTPNSSCVANRTIVLPKK